MPKDKHYVYKIMCTKTGKSYIGISKNWKKRISQHKNSLVKNKHYNIYLQRHFNKYSNGDFDALFEISILKKCSRDILHRFERFYIHKNKTHQKKHGFNLTLGGEYPAFSSKLRSKINRNKAKNVYMYNIDGNYIMEFNSVPDASEYTGFSLRSIRNCLFREHQHDGFLFLRVKIDKIEKYDPKKNLIKPIHVFDVNLKKIDECVRITECAIKYMINVNTINSAARRFQFCKEKYFFIKDKDLSIFMEINNLKL